MSPLYPRARCWALNAWLLVVLGLAAHAHWPTEPLPNGLVADRVVVHKAQRELVLFRNGEALRRYTVALGGDPFGPKQREGDQRTPEGSYEVQHKNPHSSYHLALQVSYPNTNDVQAARLRGDNPGGLIMIHGLRNGLGVLGRWHRWVDWTAGCVAVTNAEIEEIWRVVPVGTPLTFLP